MGMADMLICDRLEELSNQIEDLHLIYLEQDDSPRKIEQREKLENCIREFLYLAPHSRKFAFRQTADVLHRSASTKDNFSAYRAGLAWKAVGKYADNLMAQPWRKEYREIKLYSGFYKHEIEESLVGAELMLETMGYRHTGRSTMTLPDILDPDRITNVSKDAITAYVECQIMKEIWESVSARYNFTWLDILEFRENHTGTPDQAIRALSYKAQQRQYQEQMYHKPQYVHVSDIPPTRPDCFYPQNMMGYNNHMHYMNHAYTLPMQPRYAPVVSPQQVVPPPMVYQSSAPVHGSYPQTQSVLKSQDLYPTNGYHIHPHYSSNSAHMSHNGYGRSNVHMGPVMPTYTAPATVPTAQLIELDSVPTHCLPGIGSSHVDSYGNSHRMLPHPVRHISSDRHVTLERSENHIPSGKAKEDGAGSWENWDYVYRNLESQGYKKDMGSRGDVLSPKNSYALSGSGVSDKFKRMVIDSEQENPSGTREIKSENIMKPKVDSEPEQGRLSSQDVVDIPDVSKELIKERISPCKVVKSEVVISSSIRTSPENVRNEVKRLPDNPSPNLISKKLEASSQNVKLENTKPHDIPRKPTKIDYDITETQVKHKERSVSPRKTDRSSWECVTCTYLNAPNRDICEMCSKSKSRGAEDRPQPSGGQECPKCTLVNEPGILSCILCSTSLKNSPTYI